LTTYESVQLVHTDFSLESQSSIVFLESNSRQIPWTRLQTR